jgi:hypothetical protein
MHSSLKHTTSLLIARTTYYVHSQHWEWILVGVTVSQQPLLPHPPDHQIDNYYNYRIPTTTLHNATTTNRTTTPLCSSRSYFAFTWHMPLCNYHISYDRIGVTGTTNNVIVMWVNNDICSSCWHGMAKAEADLEGTFLRRDKYWDDEVRMTSILATFLHYFLPCVYSSRGVVVLVHILCWECILEEM